jgi:L-threonylcarbamoyladenylate synthase
MARTALFETSRLAATALQSGHLVVLPTETVYGLGALASDPVAVRRVFATKGRPVDHPLIVHVATANAVDFWAIEVSAEARCLAGAFWPGPLTLIFKRHPAVIDEVTGGLDTVALRVPDHPVTLEILGLLPDGAGIAAPSANRFGQVSPTTAHAAADDLRAYLLPDDLVVDGGPCAIGVESTILDMTTEPPTVLRPGGLTIESIEKLLGRQVERNATGPSRAPGMLAAHYAPRASVLLVDPANAADSVQRLLQEGHKVGFLGPSSLPVDSSVVWLAAPDPYDGATLAPVLYERLRDADRLAVDVLVVVTPAETGLGWAVADRLRRAATATSARSR